MNEEFKKLSYTKTTKEARIIHQTTYEGTKAVKDSRLQRLTMRFKEIRMEEDKSFDEFYAKLKDIMNSVFNLGETILEPKMLERCLNLYPRDFMPRSPQLKNRRILTKFL